ncbi:hypothetical protein CJF30_00000488 [Rutstroemia sp. NJR-2017a BBW]|nr:hypothetical protein CJF30_00000488 [Rutstroemia sp. NJR-2017a BBW]
MPPRKSDVAKPTIGDEATPVKEAVVREGVNIEDLNLPKSIVQRLAKGVLPPNTQIQGNAMLAMSKSATVFINYLATHANENAQHRNIKTIQPQDVFKALEDLEFPDFKPRLEAELASGAAEFIETQSDKRSTYRKKVAADKAAPQGEENGDGDIEMGRDGDGEPKAKKARRDGKGEGAIPGDDAHEEADDTMGADDEVEGDEDVEEDNEEDEVEGEEGEEEGADERFEVEEPEGRDEDEALDNGEDSD